ncbi:hypothetical protein [Salinigranum sp. GCM10025319]|uniref:hypothetical protein n=1 Tax=Salinigranum sp. GCM10025319 TaxID=3252687 RepID=UPI0036134FE6
MVSLVHVELGIVVVMGVGLLIVAFTRLLNYRSGERSSGITKNVVRSMALILILPITAILAIESIISPAAITALYGAALGYVFSGFDV